MIKQKDRPVSNGRYRLITGDVIVANKRLTDKELDEIIKFSIDPSTLILCQCKEPDPGLL